MPEGRGWGGRGSLDTDAWRCRCECIGCWSCSKWPLAASHAVYREGCSVRPCVGRICAEARPCSPVATPGAGLHLLPFRFEDAWDGLMVIRWWSGWRWVSFVAVAGMQQRVLCQDISGRVCGLLCVCCAASIRIWVFFKCGFRTCSICGCLVVPSLSTKYTVNTLLYLRVHPPAMCSNDLMCFQSSGSKNGSKFGTEASGVRPRQPR